MSEIIKSLPDLLKEVKEVESTIKEILEPGYYDGIISDREEEMSLLRDKIEVLERSIDIIDKETYEGGGSMKGSLNKLLKQLKVVVEQYNAVREGKKINKSNFIEYLENSEVEADNFVQWYREYEFKFKSD